VQFCDSILCQVTLFIFFEDHNGNKSDFLCYPPNYFCICCCNIVLYVLHCIVHKFIEMAMRKNGKGIKAIQDSVDKYDKVMKEI